MKKICYYFLCLTSVFCFLSCQEDSDPKFEVEKFTSIFDDNRFNKEYNPIDIQQTSDGGYIVLAATRLPESNFSGIYLLKADRFGNFVKQTEVEESHVAATGRLSKYQNTFYFFCMSANNQQVELARVDANLDAVSFSNVGTGLTYPCAASLIENGADSAFLLLSYNNTDKVSEISLVSTEGDVIDSKGYSVGVGDEVEEPIINHFIRNGRQLPFSVGKVSPGLYYFNGYYNYTFSLVFTDIQDDDPVGVVQGQQDDGGFSAVEVLGGNKFSASRFNFGDNYLLPNVLLNTNGTTAAVDLGGFTFPELQRNAKVKVLRSVLNLQNVLIYGSDTRSKQIGLLFYNELDGLFIGRRYLGFSNPFEIANLINTSDGGIAVCGTTYLAGRFPRICIFKLSNKELVDLVKP